MDKKIESFFSLDSQYDSRHKLNTNAGKKVPQSVLDEIERGCSLETIEGLLKKKFNVYKYKTQITIHGEFPELRSGRVGGYKNLVRNGNKSIGVRWSAIDNEKKAELFSLLHFTDKEWSILHNSTCYMAYKMVELEQTGREQMMKQVAEFRKEAEKIDRSLFFGSVNCYLTQSFWGRRFLVLDLNVNAIYAKNVAKLFRNITGKDFEQQKSAQAAYYKAERERRERERKEWREKYERKQAEEEQQKQKAHDEFVKTLPDGFKAVEGYAPKVGDIFMEAVYDSWNKSYHWETLRAKSSFGRMILTPIDPNTGKDIDSGSVVTKVDLYLKVA